jgi:hypothetical protein
MKIPWYVPTLQYTQEIYRQQALTIHGGYVPKVLYKNENWKRVPTVNTHQSIIVT